MPPRNFPDDNITFPYPNDEWISEEDVVHFKIDKVGAGGYVGVDRDDLAWHFVAWVPLQVNASLRSTTLHDSPSNTIKPSYVQSEKGVNIGPKDEWKGRHVAIFVLDEKLSEGQKAAVQGSS